MNCFNPEFIGKMAEKYSGMNEEELIEEVKKIKAATGKKEITQEEKEKLFKSVSSFLSEQELEQLEQLLKMFE